MAFVISDGAGIDLTKITSDQRFPLGKIVQASDSSFYMYVKAGTTAPTQYEPIAIRTGFVLHTASAASSLWGAANIAYGIGIPQQSGWTASYYGWVFVGPGTATYKGFNVSGDYRLFTTATAGRVTCSSGAGYSIHGAVAQGAVVQSNTGTLIAHQRLFVERTS